MAKLKYAFGDLEQAIMDVIWDSSSLTVREVVDALRRRRVAYTTVMTVMNRLVTQRVLVRQAGPSGAFTYRARLNRHHYSAQASRRAIDDLLRRYGAVALAQFVNRLDQVPAEKLARLRRQLRQGDEA